MRGLDGSSACGFVAVMGVSCSGTSIHAQILHQLGVPMGRDEHLVSSAVDRYGHHEDRCFQKINQKTLHFMKTEMITRLRVAKRQEYVDLIRVHTNPPVWGLKSTVFHDVWPLFDEALHEAQPNVKVGIVVIHRGFRAIVQSLIRRHETVLKQAKTEPEDLEWAHAISPPQAIDRAEKELSGLFQLVRNLKYPVLHMEYEKTIDNPKQTAKDLADFTGTGADNVERAAEGVLPEWKHY